MGSATHSRPIEDGWLRDWLVLGPLDCLVTDRPAAVTAEKMPGLLLWGGEQNPDGWPEPGRSVPPTGNRWQRRRAADCTCRLELGSEGGWPRWFYAAVYLRAYERIKGTLRLTCNGCFVLRADGAPLLWHLGWPRPAGTSPLAADLDLAEGCHLLLLKLITYGDSPVFGVRLLDPEGAPFQGTRPVAWRLAPVQSMKLNVPVRGKKLSAPPEMPHLCTAVRAESQLPDLSRRGPPWSRSSPAAGFRTLDGHRARWKTSVSLSYTERELRVLCECENRRPSHTREPFPWLCDHVLVLLDSDHSHTASRAVLLNLPGDTWTRGVREEEVEATVERGEHGWAGLLRIPFAALGLAGPPDRGDRWGANFVRVCPNSSDGLTYWSDGLLHGPTTDPDAPDEWSMTRPSAGTPWWPDRPERFGHLEFGENDLVVEQLTLEPAGPGWRQLKVSIDNRGGKARAFLTCRVVGRADMWPEPVREEAEVDSADKDWLLDARSRAGTTVPLAPLSPGDYRIEVSVQVPGRDFHQRAVIPFSSPRELHYRAMGTTPAGAEGAEGAWTFHLAERPPHELLLTARGRWPGGEPELLWNQHPLEPRLLPLPGADRAELEAAVPPSIILKGLNELRMGRSGAESGPGPQVDHVTLRIHEGGWRALERGERLYRFHPAPPETERAAVLLGLSPRGVPHVPARPARIEADDSLRFPALLDRPGGTLELTHADFTLEACLICPDPTCEEPPAMEACVNDREVRLRPSSQRQCLVDRRGAVRWTLSGSVPEGVLRSGVNHLSLAPIFLPAPSALLQDIRLRERRWDDPEAVNPPGAVWAGEEWQMELRSARHRTIRRVELPPHLEAAFECPRQVEPGRTALRFRALEADGSQSGQLGFDEDSVLFSTPPVLPRPPLPPGRQAAEWPLHRLEDGSLEVQLAAIRGTVRAAGHPRFRVDTRGLTVPHGTKDRMRLFQRCLDATLFLAGAELPEPCPPGFPTLHRRDGLPAADTLVLRAGGRSHEPRPDELSAPNSQATVRALLGGHPFPGPGGPIFPSGPTGHFNGTPHGKFDVLSGAGATRQLTRYRLILLTGGPPGPHLLSALREAVEDHGCRVLLTPSHAAALEAFGISLEGTGRGRRVRFRAVAGLGEHTMLSAGPRYRIFGGEPDETHATFEPQGHVLLGRWRRGRGDVFATAVAPERGEAERRAYARCVDRVVGSMRPLVRCPDELVNVSVFPDSPELNRPPCAALDRDGEPTEVPPLRIYAAHCGWWQTDRSRVECTLRVAGKELPLSWAPGRVKSVFLSGGLALTSGEDACYVQTVSRRPDGYEVQVRGTGTHDIIALPLTGRIASVRCRGREMTVSPEERGDRVVGFPLEVSGLTRFQVTIK